MEVTNIFLGPLEKIFPALTEQRDQFWYVGKEVLKSLDYLNRVYSCELPLTVQFAWLSWCHDTVNEYVSFILYIWERYLIIIQFYSTECYINTDSVHFHILSLRTFLNILISYSFLKLFQHCTQSFKILLAMLYNQLFPFTFIPGMLNNNCFYIPTYAQISTVN